MKTDDIVVNKVLPDSKLSSATDGHDWNSLALEVQHALLQGHRSEAYSTFRKIQHGTARVLLRFLRGKLPNIEDANDLIGRVYLDFYRALEKPDPVTNVMAFLYSVGNRRVVDFWRQKSGTGTNAQASTGEWRSRELTSDTIFWDQQADKEQNSDLDSVEATEERLFAEQMAPLILERLRPDLRDVLIRRHCEQLSVAETALALNITEDKVKKRNQEAIKEAQRIIQNETRIPS